MGEREQAGVVPAALPLIRPTVVSMATPDGYQQKLNTLRASLHHTGCPHALHTIPRSERLIACSRKPSIIRKEILKHEAVLWLDADSVVRQGIWLPGDGWDVGTLPHRYWGTERFAPERHQPISAAVLAIRPTAAGLGFLDLWDYWVDTLGPENGDHEPLTRAYQGIGARLLPLERYLSGRVTLDVGQDKAHNP
jgi:hypothetical protein